MTPCVRAPLCAAVRRCAPLCAAVRRCARRHSSSTPLGLIHDYGVHGLRVRIVGDLPVALEPARSGALIVAHVQGRPLWAREPLDPSQLLVAAAGADGGGTFVDAGAVRGGAGFRLRFREGATFWISAGLDEIWFEYEAPLTDVDAVYFLFEPVLAFVLRRRGVLAMHASAVEMDGRAVLLCGAAGSGKSTTASACMAAGYALMSDDVVALGVEDGSWQAHRGTGIVRLWDDGARALGHAAESLPRFSATWNKRTVAAVGSARSELARAPVGLVCVLGRDDDASIVPGAVRITGAAAFRELVVHTAANRLHDPRRRAAELPQLAALVGAVPVVRLRFPRDGTRLAEVVRTIRSAVHG